MKVLVTGGAGFIGSHLVEALVWDNHEVIVLDNFSTGRRENLRDLKTRAALRVHALDISKDPIDRFFQDIDWVFHLAALADIIPSIERPQQYHQSNVDGSIKVLEASRKAGVKRFVYAASSSCYGIPDAYPTPETAPLKPQYPYALTKMAAEQYVLHWGKIYKLPVVSLRLFNVYGPKSRTSGAYGAVFGVFLAQKIHSKPFTVVGDGAQTRDFTFVTDTVQAFLKAAKSSFKNEIFNVGSGNTYSVNRIVELLKGDAVHIPKRPGEPDCTFADISKIKQMLDWHPTISLEEGISIMLKNIHFWKDAPIWTPDSIAKATKEWFNKLSPSQG